MNDNVLAKKGKNSVFDASFLKSACLVGLKFA
jgi:hypothetical protein